MITIINKYTGEEITKYSNARKSEATEDSFIAPVKASGAFRCRWGAITEYFNVMSHCTQVVLKQQYAVKELM